MGKKTERRRQKRVIEEDVSREAQTELQNARWSGDAERIEEAIRRVEAQGLSPLHLPEIAYARVEAQRLRSECVRFAQIQLEDANRSGDAQRMEAALDHERGVTRRALEAERLGVPRSEVQVVRKNLSDITRADGPRLGVHDRLRQAVLLWDLKRFEEILREAEVVESPTDRFRAAVEAEAE